MKCDMCKRPADRMIAFAFIWANSVDDITRLHSAARPVCARHSEAAVQHAVNTIYDHEPVDDEIMVRYEELRGVDSAAGFELASDLRRQIEAKLDPADLLFEQFAGINSDGRVITFRADYE